MFILGWQPQPNRRFEVSTKIQFSMTQLSKDRFLELVKQWRVCTRVHVCSAATLREHVNVWTRNTVFCPQNGLMTGKLVYEICPDLEFEGGAV